MMDSMAVSKGYKTSDIGLIPNQWSIYLLGEIVSMFRGGSPRPIQDFLTTSTKGINWIKIGDASVGAKYIDSTKEKIIPEGITRSRYVEAGDVLLSNSMSFGRPYILRTNGCIHDGWLVLKNFGDKIDKDYLYYMLSSNVILKQYKSKAAGSGVLNLNKKLVASVNLLLPPLREQKAIAEVLTDTDNTILSLEKLIDKKKKIKQGAMQQLLTGEKRLSAYNSDWEMKKLGEVAKVIMGQSPASQNYNTNAKGLPLIQGNADIKKRKSIARVYTTQITKSCNTGDIIMTVRAPVGAIGKATRESCLGRGVCSIDYKNDYLYYYLLSIEDKWTQMSKGSTFDSISSKEVWELDIFLPSDEQEQKAIAQILSNMDAEIEALEEKLEKYKKIKQGMMQELLTGRIRLK